MSEPAHVAVSHGERAGDGSVESKIEGRPPGILLEFVCREGMAIAK
ncbi:MAG: hypothetical protein ABIT61_09885 [Steroidobacteraceae bacterium]